ncbi:MAG: FixH family protein [Leptospirales bacterium]|nr:FixH family protein [Leptospirales bacterium]
MSRSLRTAFITIGLFFAVLFAAGAYTMKLAFAGHEPALNEGYYEMGLDYQPRLDALRRGREQGWRLLPDFENHAVLSNAAPVVVWRLQAPPGRSIESAKLSITVEHPASVRGRRQVQATLDQAQREGPSMLVFRTPLKFERSGVYEIQAELSVNDAVVVGVWQLSVASGAH